MATDYPLPQPGDKYIQGDMAIYVDRVHDGRVYYRRFSDDSFDFAERADLTAFCREIALAESAFNREVSK